MTRYERVAQAAIYKELRDREDPVTLWTVSCWAESAAQEAGKKRELYPSLYDYAGLLPITWMTAWLKSSDSPLADSMLYVVPRPWQSGESDSNSLLLGGGKLRFA